MPTIVAGLIRRHNDVLLVRQQGPDDVQPAWALPGGVCETGELAAEALAREIREEAGIVIERPNRLLYVAQLHNPTDHVWSHGEAPAIHDLATIFVFEVTAWSGDLQSNDPDGFIREASFLPLEEAVTKLEQLPWPSMREPIVAYLRGQVDAGAMWLYRRRSDSADQLEMRIAPDRGATFSDPRRTPVMASIDLQDPATNRRTSIVILGCLVLLVALIALVIVGLIAVTR